MSEGHELQLLRPNNLRPCEPQTITFQHSVEENRVLRKAVITAIGNIGLGSNILVDQIDQTFFWAPLDSEHAFTLWHWDKTTVPEGQRIYAAVTAGNINEPATVELLGQAPALMETYDSPRVTRGKTTYRLI